jgi:hypothetical protein
MKRKFRPLQAGEIARSFMDEDMEYLFIGESGAILPGNIAAKKSRGE